MMHRAPTAQFHVVLTSNLPRIAWNQWEYSAEPGPAALRAAADRLAGCGQADDDPLDVRVFVDGGWPWEVEILEATHGAEACLAGVLSQLPLDADLAGGKRYVASRTTVAALREPPSEEVDPTECELVRPMMVVGTVGQHTHLRHPDRVALAVTCPAATPVTELTVRYEGGALAEVATTPVVGCVEERAWDALRDPAALDILTTKDPLPAWDVVTCAVPVPLRPL
jgi:hypothetical protein